MYTTTVLVGKGSLCFISIVNYTVSFEPEFLCTIEISHIELVRPSYIQSKTVLFAMLARFLAIIPLPEQC
jgi:hypothetical protein